MRFSSFAIVCVVATAPVLGHADTPTITYPTITLSVGGNYEQIAEAGQQCICDDKTLVAPEYAGDKIRLVGIKAGRTLCGFTHFVDGKYLGNLIYDVTVTPAQPAPAKVPSKPGKGTPTKPSR